MAVLRANDRKVRLLALRDPSKLLDLGTFVLDAMGSASVENAAADISRGLWLPLGEYGVQAVLLPPGDQ